MKMAIMKKGKMYDNKAFSVIESKQQSNLLSSAKQKIK